MAKTNAERILESNGIKFGSSEYEFDENELDAQSVARKVGANDERVFKTLVAQSGNREYFVFVIPGNYELDLKKAAKSAGVKKIELIPVKQLLPLTGYIRGGCSPIGMKKKFPTFIDETCQLFDEIYVSAGVRGKQIIIAPSSLAKVVDAELTDLI